MPIATQSPQLFRVITPKVLTPIQKTIEDTDKDLDLAEYLIPMLSRERAEKKHFWFDVGRGLYKSAERAGDLEAGLALWIRFTEQSDVFSDEDCRNEYYKFQGTSMSVKTIAWYAREDSPEEYARWHSNVWLKPVMEEAIKSHSHADVAKALYRMYWLEFTCSSAEKAIFWYFINHRWMRLNHGTVLRQRISEEFRRKFEEWRAHLCTATLGEMDNDKKNTCDTMVKRVNELIHKLKTVPFKSNIMAEARDRFYDDDFVRVQDDNPEIFCLLNCVVEICDGKAEVRPGKPEDYITMSAPVPYRKDMHYGHPLVQRLMKWISQVFVETELREYFLRMAASCLRGMNADKIFPIWTGEGDNSKSMIVLLFEATFGQYCGKLSVASITGARSQSGTANPEMIRHRGKRVVFMQEPDDAETVKGGIVKELTEMILSIERFIHART